VREHSEGGRDDERKEGEMMRERMESERGRGGRQLEGERAGGR
jgi:hypothetical protein